MTYYIQLRQKGQSSSDLGHDGLKKSKMTGVCKGTVLPYIYHFRIRRLREFDVDSSFCGTNAYFLEEVSHSYFVTF